MYDFLQREFFDNTIESYLVVIGSFIVALLLRRLISKYLAALIFTLVMRTDTTINKQGFINLIVKPLELFLLLFITFGAIDRLNYPDALNFKLFKIPVQVITDALYKAVLITVFIWLLLRIIDFAAYVLEEKASKTGDQNHNQLVVFFKDFFKVLLLIIGVLLLLKFSFGQNIGNLLTGLSIVGAAIALATRESLENLIASFIIFFDKPFITGDTVKVEGFVGTVEKIGLRSTRVRTDHKTYITIPNKKMVDSILDNLTMRTQRKVETRLDVSLSATTTQLRQLVSGIKTILQKDGVEDKTVFVSDTGKESHVITVDYMTNVFQTNEEFIGLREQVNLEIITLLEELKVKLTAANKELSVHTK
jgi:MscS family membrane protein